MAARTVLTTDTLETFRTTFNSLAGTDIGDPAGLNTTAQTIVAAINEVDSAISANDLDFSADAGANGSISDSQTFQIAGTANNIVTTSNAAQKVTLSLASTISGLTSISATTITDGTASINSGSITGVVNITGSGTLNMTTDVQVNGVSLSSQAFAIAQAVALG